MPRLGLFSNSPEASVNTGIADTGMGEEAVRIGRPNLCPTCPIAARSLQSSWRLTGTSSFTSVLSLSGVELKTSSINPMKPISSSAKMNAGLASLAEVGHQPEKLLSLVEVDGCSLHGNHSQEGDQGCRLPRGERPCHGDSVKLHPQDFSPPAPVKSLQELRVGFGRSNVEVDQLLPVLHNKVLSCLCCIGRDSNGHIIDCSAPGCGC